MVGGGAGTTGSLRARVANGRPNWWVILAVSLALMALLVATSPAPHAWHRQTTAQVAPHGHERTAPRSAADGPGHPGPPVTAVTTTTAPGAAVAASAPPVRSFVSAAAIPATAAAPSTTTTTTTTAQPATTSASAPAAVPADRTQAQGDLDPPLTTTNEFAFTGSGAMEVSVVWSGGSYLAMEVSCPGASQSVGGTDAMAATLPEAVGSCTATVSEPPAENASVTYTITIEPLGG
ncbi:MAG TPA: hypothetical protein VEH82_08065 [Acidimicrobiales bacterium]|nr:hypothetical protein [Acidimicrobiales bacterium]